MRQFVFIFIVIVVSLFNFHFFLDFNSSFTVYYWLSIRCRLPLVKRNGWWQPLKPRHWHTPNIFYHHGILSIYQDFRIVFRMILGRTKSTTFNERLANYEIWLTCMTVPNTALGPWSTQFTRTQVFYYMTTIWIIVACEWDRLIYVRVCVC